MPWRCRRCSGAPPPRVRASHPPALAAATELGLDTSPKAVSSTSPSLKPRACASRSRAISALPRSECASSASSLENLRRGAWGVGRGAHALWG
jgi:hypothetical protein